MIMMKMKMNMKMMKYTLDKPSWKMWTQLGSGWDVDDWQFRTKQKTSASDKIRQII